MRVPFITSAFKTLTFEVQWLPDSMFNTAKYDLIKFEFEVSNSHPTFNNTFLFYNGGFATLVKSWGMRRIGHESA